MENDNLQDDLQDVYICHPETYKNQILDKLPEGWEAVFILDPRYSRHTVTRVSRLEEIQSIVSAVEAQEHLWREA